VSYDNQLCLMMTKSQPI